MITCPLCKTELPDATPRCPRCQSDLSLLTAFTTDLKTLLDKADAHRRAGELAPAVQAYLSVLEIDPTNSDARAAVGPVLLGIRSAETIARPKRRFVIDLFFGVLVVAAFAAGFLFCLWMMHELVSQHPLPPG